jgi:hypothetical protein
MRIAEMTKYPPIYTLHRYWLWANTFNLSLKAVLQDQGPAPDTPREFRRWLRKPYQHLSYWLATLYVIVEGWAELKLADRKIDELIQNRTRVNLLRRFRNGVFHFQPDYFSSRAAGFLSGRKEHGLWAQRLHEAFGEFFLKWYTQQGMSFAVRHLDDDELEVTIRKNSRRRSDRSGT